MKAIPQKRTKATAATWRQPFLEAYEKTGIVTLSAKAAAVHVRTVYREIDKSAEFKKQFEEAREKAVDALEAAALLRATQGIEEPVWMKNENGVPVKVDTLRRYSDTLLIFLLKANRPAKYRDIVRQEISGPGGLPIQTAQVHIDMAAVQRRVAEAVEGEERMRLLEERGLVIVPPIEGGGNGNGHNGDDPQDG
jgi:hypothetical protein